MISEWDLNPWPMSFSSGLDETRRNVPFFDGFYYGWERLKADHLNLLQRAVIPQK